MALEVIDNKTKAHLFHQVRLPAKWHHLKDLCLYPFFYSVHEVGFWCVCFGNRLTRNTSLSKKENFVFSSEDVKLN